MWSGLNYRYSSEETNNFLHSKVDELVKLSHNGKIDCLVNNAGISMRGSVIDTDMAVQRKVMETNYFGQVKKI